MKSRVKKPLAILLAMIMVLSLLPTVAFATEAPTLAGFDAIDNVTRTQKIKTITFYDDVSALPSGSAIASWDVGTTPGTVMAYTYANTDPNYYDLYVDATQGLKLPRNSIGLFEKFSTGQAGTSVLEKMIGAELLDTSDVINMGSMFTYLNNLKSVDVSTWDMSGVISISKMFLGCTHLETLNVSDWDTSSIKGMEQTFMQCLALDTLDVSNWDTSNVTTMKYMFNSCEALKKLEVGNWDTSNVTNMNFTFDGLQGLTEPLDVSNWNVSKVTNMAYLFAGYPQTTLDVSNWDTANVTDMSFLFSNCANVTTLDVSDWNTSKVTDMGYLFSYCKSVTELDVSSFDTSKVTEFGQMFAACEKVEKIDVSIFDTSKLQTMWSMFHSCKALKELDLSSWDMTSLIQEHDAGFANKCPSLTHITFGPGWDNPSITYFQNSDVSSMFHTNPQLPTDIDFGGSTKMKDYNWNFDNRTVNELPTTYRVTYYNTGSTAGEVPTDASSPYQPGADVTVLGNTGNLERTNYTFKGWATQAYAATADYTVEAIAAGTAIFAINANTNLYPVWEKTTDTYNVTYHATGATSGTVPTDTNSPYAANAEVTVLGNTGNLEKTDHTFKGWATKANSATPTYTVEAIAAGTATFTITADTHLYPVWEENAETYTVLYHDTGATSGTAPTDPNSPYQSGADVTVLGNTGNLEKTDYTFKGWATTENATTPTYTVEDIAAGTAIFAITDDTDLYPVWEANTVTYTVLYHDTGATSGTAPTDTNSPYTANAEVTVLGNTGNLEKTDYTFKGWATTENATTPTYTLEAIAAGTATFTITANTDLYPVWEAPTTGTLTISKTVVSSFLSWTCEVNGWTGWNQGVVMLRSLNKTAPADAEFIFTVTGDNETPITGTYTVAGTGAPTGEQTITNGQITLKADWKATITGLAAGSYKVSETDPGTAYATKHNINGGADVSGRDCTVSITAGGTTTVDYHNAFVPSIMLSKEVSGTGTPNANAEFTFTIKKGTELATGKYYIGEGAEQDIVDGKITLKAGEVAVISGLDNAAYTITEITPTQSNYSSTEYVLNEGTATAGTTATVTVDRTKIATLEYNNIYAAPTTGTLTISKTVVSSFLSWTCEVNGWTGWNQGVVMLRSFNKTAPADAEFIFTVTGDNETPITGTYTVAGTGAPTGEQTITNGQITLKADWKATITGLAAGSYKVSETDPGTAYATKHNINGGADVSGRDCTVSITAGETTTVDYHNAFVPSIMLSKEVSGTGTPNANAEFTFTIKKGTELATGKYYIGDGAEQDIVDGKITLKAGEVAVISALDNAAYTITETTPTQSNYSSTEYVLDEGTAAAGTTATVTVDRTKIATLEYNNIYETTGGGPGGDPTTYTLTFNTNGGTPVPSITRSAGSVIPLTQTTTKSGYVFEGWYTDVALTNKVISVTLNGNMTVYAKWTATDAPEMFRTDHVSYIIGYPDGNVHPEANITRGETATIFFRLLTDASRSSYWKTSNSFSDVSSDLWFNNAVSTMANARFIIGYDDGTFGGNRPITRAEFATIAARANGADGEDVETDKLTDVSGHWAAGFINEAVEMGLIEGYPDGTFKPDAYITRAEAMTIVNRFLGRDKVDSTSLITGMITWPDNKTSDWYYYAVQEATNSHEYTRQSNNVETWTEIVAVPDWVALEKSWSTANSAK